MGYPSGIALGYAYAGGRLQQVQATIDGVTHTVAAELRYRLARWRAGSTATGWIATTTMTSTTG